MKILVTGATGFLGAALVPRLLKAGHQVRMISRAVPTQAELKGAEHVLGDLLHPEAVQRAMEGVEALYHLAGLVDFDPQDGGRQMYRLHCDATREVLKAAREAKVKRVVLASTSGAVAVSKEERVGTEADDYPITVVGQWPYYLSKIYEEKLALEFCKQHAIPLVVCNPSLLLGPGDERLSSSFTVVKFLNGDLPGVPNGGISFVDVRDAADAFVQALTRGDLYGRHLMGVNMTLREFLERLARISGVAMPPLRLPKQGNILGARLLEKLAKFRGVEPGIDSRTVEISEHFFWLDASKAERELGFTARDPQETLFDTVQYILGRMAPGSLPGTRGRLEELRKGT
ncbi:MAG: NAD-dependent epimerase/dehydratase family protein [Myxococcota bacterium]|nr:NAD-dependent epimerase/dehydratase family protein [Myxococcota bacterium]